MPSAILNYKFSFSLLYLDYQPLAHFVFYTVFHLTCTPLLVLYPLFLFHHLISKSYLHPDYMLWKRKWVLFIRIKQFLSCWVYTVKYFSDGSVEHLKTQLVVKGHTQTYGVDRLETSPVASLNFVQICFLLAFLWLKGNMSLIFCLKLISSWVLMLLILLWALLLKLILSKDNYILMSVDTGAWLGSWFILLLLVLKFFMPLLCLVNIYMLPVSLIMKPFS